MFAPLNKLLKKCGIVAGLSSIAFSALALQQADVGVPADVLKDYTEFLNGRNANEITDYSGPKSRRDVVELVLVQQAIARSGADIKVNFVPESEYTEILRKVTDGELVAAGTSVWKSDLVERRDSVFITTAMISRGEFEAGFYTHPNNKTALAANSREKIRSLIGVSSETWTIDWKTLTALNMRTLKNTPDWGEMVRQVSEQETDFLLAPFQAGADMELDIGREFKLVPIRDIKIGLDGSRHLAVSRKHALGGQFNSALHLGLLRLKPDGVLTKAYEQSGFFNGNVRDWELVSARTALFGN